MSVTQYIGARYVPIFANPVIWDSTKEYEPLTIVTYEGASYTSKQAVPAGISISNENYWVLTGNYNAQVEAYRNETRQLQATVNENTTNIANEITAREEADSELSEAIDIEETARISAITAEESARIAADNDLNDAIETEETARIAADENFATQITTINNNIDILMAGSNIYQYFNGFNAVIIGDSYAYGTGSSDHGAGETKRWSTQLCNWLNANEFNFAVGSTGFCDPGSGGQNAPFKTQVLNAANAMTEAEKNNTHLVVIAGGVNDYNEGSTYGASDMRNGAYNAAQNAADNFSNALIVIVPMLFKGHDANPRLFNFENSIISGVSGYYHVNRTVCIRGAWTWNFGRGNYFNSDELHPNDDGHRVIASNIYANILGGTAYENQLYSISFDSGFSSNVANGGYLMFENGIIQSMGTLVQGTIEAGEITLIGSVSGSAVPLVNVVVPIMKSNAQAGVCIITGSGNVYVRNSTSSDISGDFFIAPFSYMPKGAF